MKNELTTPASAPAGELQKRQDAVLELTDKIKDIISHKLTKTLSAAELCGLTRALERVNEIETTILTAEQDSTKQADALTLLCATITAAANE